MRKKHPLPLISRLILIARRTRRDARYVILGGLCTLLAVPPCLYAQNLDLGIVDEATYADAVSAISKAEYVRYDFVNTPRPRVAASVAALMEFATRNPLATGTQLTAFVQAYAAALAAARPGDPELRRGASLMPALRFEADISPTPELVGFDTNVGAAAMALIGMEVGVPFDFNSLENRTIDFEAVRERSLANSVEWLNLLVVGLLGHDLLGNDDPDLAGVMQSYLESEGYEPVPDGIDDERFNLVDAGLAALPPNFADYQTAITVPMGQEVPPIWNDINSQFQIISTCTDALIAGIAQDDAGAPTLLEGIAMREDPTILDQLSEDLQRRLDDIATPRAVLAGNTLLMLQNADPSIRRLGAEAQEFASVQANINQAAAIGGAALAILGGAATILAGVGILVATGVTGAGIAVGVLTIIAGVGIAGIGVAQLGGALGLGDAPPSPEQQILDQIVEVRQDIENLRVQMNQRFDRIEAQLNVIYQGMASGLNTIASLIGDLNVDVENLTRDVLLNRAALERIEDALWGMAQDLLDADLAIWANTYMNYRIFNGVDLPYAGSGGDESYLEGSNEFFTVAVDIAKNETLAGPNASALTLANADEMLNDESIGRMVNDLRTFPQQLGLSSLAPTRVVAPAPWTQGAAAYSQFARENPWYFAYQYEQQTFSALSRGGPIPDVERVIQEGQTLANAANAGRSQALWDALFDGYNTAVADLNQAIVNHMISNALIPSSWTDEPGGDTTVDPLAGTEQDVRVLAFDFSGLESCDPSFELTLPNDPTNDYWGVFRSGGPALNEIVGFGGIPQWCAPSDSELVFSYEDFECLQTMATRTLTYNLSGGPIAPPYEAFVKDQWDCGVLRDALLSGENLTGQVLNLPACAAHPDMDMTIVSDVYEDLGSFCSNLPLECDLKIKMEENIDPVLSSLITELQDPGSNTLKDAMLVLSDWASLMDAYATMSLPFAMESSNVLRSALGADVNQPEVPAKPVEEFEQRADDWLLAVPRAERYAFDQGYPGVPAGTGCLEAWSGERQLIKLDGGSIKMLSFNGNVRTCEVEDRSALERTSDGNLPTADAANSRVELDFDPPICAFYTFYASFDVGTSATIKTYDRFGALLDTHVSSASTHATDAIGHGFTSDIPVGRVVISSNDFTGLLLGAFEGLAAGEASLGTVNIPGYAGPDGDDVLIDFACQFVEEPNAMNLALHGPAVLPLLESMFLGSIDLNSIEKIMLQRSAIAQQEINDALATDAHGHPYLEYMLADLRDLRDEAFDLAAPDSYMTMPDTPLMIDVMSGLTANDVKQPCRTTEVDVLFSPGEGFIAPQNGQVSINADGSFTYTPNLGFTGTDRFNYRTGTSVAGLGCAFASASRGVLDQFVFSNPADVVIIVAPPELCPGDSDGNGTVNFADITSVLNNWLDDYTPDTGPGDADGNGVVNFADITTVLNNWLDVCP